MKRRQWYENLTKAWPLPTPRSHRTITLKDTLGVIMITAAVIGLVHMRRSRQLRRWFWPAALAAVGLMLYDPYRYVLPYNFALSALTTTPPFLDKERYFPEWRTFEDPEVWRRIRSELDEVLKDDKSIPFIHEYDRGQSYIGRDTDGEKGWRIFALKTMDRKIDKNCAKMPFTSALVDSIPRINTAMFSILDGNKHIPIHTGYYKGIFRYHLGMIVPEPSKTSLHVHGQEYHWKEGEGVVFDDMFPHQVYNKSPKRRVVLWFDIRRPLVPPFDVLGRFMDGALCRSKYVQRNARKLEKQRDL